jgi:teichuronic acid exporter
MFKVMVLGGFVLPVNGLFITVLSSMGNSKAFLNLEVLKKILMLLPFSIFIFSNEIIPFLYFSLIISLVTLFINFSFVKKEIGVEVIHFLKPLLRYILLVLVIGLIVNYGVFFMSFNRFFRLILIGGIYTILYVGSAFLLKLHGANTAIVYIYKIKNYLWKS